MSKGSMELRGKLSRENKGGGGDVVDSFCFINPLHMLLFGAVKYDR